MSTLTDFVEFVNISRTSSNDFQTTAACILERELLSNPIAFGLKYDVELVEDDLALLHSHAITFLSITPKPTCPSTSGAITYSLPYNPMKGESKTQISKEKLRAKAKKLKSKNKRKKR